MKNYWMQTYTGKKFDLLNPKVEDVDIIDIAHSLSMQCRYNGHTLKFYSVAEHCVHVMNCLPTNLRLAGLLHDAAEAYVGDCISPLKTMLSSFKGIEFRILEVIAKAFSCEEVICNDYIKQVDLDILKDEHEQAMIPGLEWHTEGRGTGCLLLQFWTPEEAKSEFLSAFWRYVDVDIKKSIPYYQPPEREIFE
jgi:hypothetical protein